MYFEWNPMFDDQATTNFMQQQRLLRASAGLMSITLRRRWKGRFPRILVLAVLFGWLLSCKASLELRQAPFEGKNMPFVYGSLLHRLFKLWSLLYVELSFHSLSAQHSLWGFHGSHPLLIYVKEDQAFARIWKPSLVLNVLLKCIHEISFFARLWPDESLQSIAVQSSRSGWFAFNFMIPWIEINQ